MKIHIFYEPVAGPWGGGNQFLKALMDIYRRRDMLRNLEECDAVLINSHHFKAPAQLKRLLVFLKNNPGIPLIHRLDGPVTLIRNRDEGTDRLIFAFNKMFCDASIFQSGWCEDHCKKLGLDTNAAETVIYNAPNPAIFYRRQKRQTDGKIKLIATSWSSAPGKGFDIYQWMDENLNWTKYDMTFVGNSPVSFKNIKILPPVDSNVLGEILRGHDIFITASRCDPCSNSLIEALHCGLPSVGYHDGGHPELIGQGGETFQKPDDIPAILQRMQDQYERYAQNITLPSLDQVGDAYAQFMHFCMGKPNKASSASDEDIDRFVSDYKKYMHVPLLLKIRRAAGYVLKPFKKRGL